MKLQLESATLIKRYKRFLADIILPNQTETTIHCANTGAMTGCAVPNDTIFFSKSDNPKRKYPFSWELTKSQNNHWICINTIRANQLIEEALNQQVIRELQGFTNLKREVKYGNENSKIDFYLTDDKQQSTYIEVKSVTLLEDGIGYFPDAKTERGQKHLRELMEVKKQGHRAILIFAVLHSGINSVTPAQYIDEKYNELFKQAIQRGVEVIAYKATFTNCDDNFDISINQPVPVLV